MPQSGWLFAGKNVPLPFLEAESQDQGALVSPGTLFLEVTSQTGLAPTTTSLNLHYLLKAPNECNWEQYPNLGMEFSSQQGVATQWQPRQIKEQVTIQLGLCTAHLGYNGGVSHPASPLE